MPTNRKRMSRTPKGGQRVTDAAMSYFSWGGVLGCGPGKDWADERTPEEIDAFWKEHRDEIMSRYMAEQKRRGWVAERPPAFWDEIESKRRRRGVEKWIGPVRADGGDRTMTEPKYESDFAFLKRLNLLEPWELELGKKR